MRISGIYKIVNRIDGKYYVGSTNNFHKRWNFGHKLPLNENRHDNPKLQNAWNKHGRDNFDCVLVETVEQENLLLVEQKYLNIARLEPDKCYNLSFIAGKIEMTDEVRQKLSRACKGRKLSDETKEKMRKRMLGIQLTLGMKHTEEAKRKIGDYNRGGTISEEQKEKISKTLMGHSVSEETREKLRLSNKGHKPWNTGKQRTEETKRKIAESLRKRNQLKKLSPPALESPEHTHPQVLPEDKTEKPLNKTT